MVMTVMKWSRMGHDLNKAPLGYALLSFSAAASESGVEHTVRTEMAYTRLSTNRSCQPIMAHNIDCAGHLLIQQLDTAGRVRREHQHQHK